MTRIAGYGSRVAVGIWVAIGVAGLIVLVLPSLRLWRAVRVLGKEVKRVSIELGTAGAALEQASRNLPRGSRPN